MSEHEQGPPGARHRAPEPAVGPAEAALAVRIAVDVQACPLVAGLHGGDLADIATGTDGGRLVGVRVHGGTVTVGVVGREPASPDAVADQVRAAVAEHSPHARVDVDVVAHHDRQTDAVRYDDGGDGSGTGSDDGTPATGLHRDRR